MKFFKKLNKFFAFILILSSCCDLQNCAIAASSTGDNSKTSCNINESNCASDVQSDSQSNCDIAEDKYSVDCIFSVGSACRPAAWIQKFGMRYQSSPLDWMMGYSLDTAINLFKTKFEDFFEEIEEIPDKFCGNCKYVKDTKNKITSIHHFHKDVPLEVQHKEFRATMLRRAKKVDEILKKSESIGLICNRSNVTPENLIDFIKKFSEIYPNKKIVLINVFDSNTEVTKKSVLFKEDNLTVVQFDFLDKKCTEDNLPNWMGNVKEWESIMNTIELKKNNSTTDESANL